MRGYRVPALLAIGGLLLLAVLSARGRSAVPVDPRDPEPLTFQPVTPSELPDLEPTVAAPPEDSGAADVVGIVSVTVIALLILAALLLLVLHALHHRRPPRENLTAGPGLDDADGTALRERLRDAAERARGTLAAPTGGPPGDAVVAAWLTLEDAAEHEGAGRAPHQTTTEFTVALLAGHTTDEQALLELRGLYQRARFGDPDAIDERDSRAALAALDRVLRGLRDTDTPAPA